LSRAKKQELLSPGSAVIIRLLMEKKKITAVLFDMDGVLVDSEPVIEEAAVKALKEYGVDARPGDFAPFVGAGDDRYIGGVAEKYGLKYKKEMKERLYGIYLGLVESRMGVFEGAVLLLGKLREKGYVLALATSADRIKAEANLKAAGISGSFFSCIMTGEDVSKKKPSPEIYLKTAAALAFPPSRCAVVEDALNGVLAAKRAGMVCIGVSTSFSACELADAGADYACGKISEVLDALEEINRNKGR
jgi:beta-phosphoglucomutase